MFISMDLPSDLVLQCPVYSGSDQEKMPSNILKQCIRLRYIYLIEHLDPTYSELNVHKSVFFI